MNAFDAARWFAHRLANAGVCGVLVQAIGGGFRVGWNSIDEGQPVDAIALCDGAELEPLQGGIASCIIRIPRTLAPEVTVEPYDVNEIDFCAPWPTEQFDQPWWRAAR